MKSRLIEDDYSVTGGTRSAGFDVGDAESFKLLARVMIV